MCHINKELFGFLLLFPIVRVMRPKSGKATVVDPQHHNTVIGTIVME